MNYRIRETCRLCDAPGLVTVLQLAPTPLANEFTKDVVERPEMFPLYLARCQACGHVQLPVVVDPERLFRDYVYVSGTSPSFVKHFDDFAESQQSWLKPQDLVVEIGSNDGTLLKAFKKRGQRIWGVDPAHDIAIRANEDGIQTSIGFFDRRMVEVIKRDAWSPNAKLIVANNVFAHADDLREIALGVKDLLAEDGRFVFEVQYLRKLVDNCLFDMIYHEHLSYHSVGPLFRFFRSMDMLLLDVEFIPTHGGSIRCTVVKRQCVYPGPDVMNIMEKEKQALTDHAFCLLGKKIESARARLFETLIHLPTDDRVVGFGAPAKLTTLMHQFGLGAEDIEYVVDDSPWKQGLRTPGTGIPVVAPSRLQADIEDGRAPDKIVIFAWNFAEQIAAKWPHLAGRFIVPLPEYREL